MYNATIVATGSQVPFNGLHSTGAVREYPLQLAARGVNAWILNEWLPEPFPNSQSQ